MIGRNCASCRYWHTGWDRRDWQTGQCRRHAPEYAEGSGPFPRVEARWPAMEGKGWCGDYERDTQGCARCVGDEPVEGNLRCESCPKKPRRLPMLMKRMGPDGKWHV